MKSDSKDTGLAVAVFRHGVIADVLRLPRGSRERAALLRAKAEQEHEIPGSERRRIAVGTLRAWIRAFRRAGLDGLRPKRRSDRGRSRRIPEAVADQLKRVKEQRPQLSTRLVIHEARVSGRVEAGQPLPHATVHRLLAQAGLTTPRSQPAPDCRRFEHEWANDLWQSDVLHGPKVGCDPDDRRKRRKTYLTAVLDDSTRVVPYAAFDFHENTGCLLAVLRKAVMSRGVPQRLLVDNGACYRSRLLRTVCAGLDICLVHSTPYRPQGKGKIERFFRTLRSQFLTRVTDKQLASLEVLNRSLRVWIEGEYHHSPHRGLGEDRSPLDCWAERSEHVRELPPGTDLLRLCMRRHRRRVLKDRTLHFRGRLYETTEPLGGRTVTLFEDPDAPPERPIELECDGEPAGHAVPLDARANARRWPARPHRRSAGQPAPPAQGDPDSPADSPRAMPLRRLQRPAPPDTPEDND